MWWPLDRRRSAALLGVVALGWGAFQGLVWMISPSPEELAAEGRELFIHEWTPNDPLSGDGDGLGPVFNAKSCVACHFQGGTGGAGDVQHNVSAFQVLPHRGDPSLQTGVVHSNAVSESFLEIPQRVRELFPIVPGGVTVVAGCRVRTEDFDPLGFESVNTPALFGAGLIDDISGWAIRRDTWMQTASAIGDELNGEFDTPAGRARILPDGRVGKFGWKAQFATLREFVATACAVEVGLSNSLRRQDAPCMHMEDDTAELDMTDRQLDSLVMFCRKLGRPSQILPVDPVARANVVQGEALFAEIGCTGCHTPELGGVQGIYSELCLHSIARRDQSGYVEHPEFPIPENIPAPDEWKTPPLWGVADSAPYLHDGSARTLDAAIRAHKGEAMATSRRYSTVLNDAQRQSIIAFLKTLRVPPQAE